MSLRIAIRWMPLVALLLLARGAIALAAPSDDERFLAGLRERRLFDLAEKFCEQRLGDNDLTDAQRADLVIEQIRTFAAHAIHSPPQDRDEQWAKARDAAEQLRRDAPNHPRLLLVLLQEALTQLARGELLRQEAEVGAGPENAQELARAEIRKAAAAIEALTEQVADQIAIRNRTPARGDELTAAELMALENHIHYHLARVFRNQALVYPAGSDDRVASLTRAIQQLEAPLRRLPAGDPLVWRILLDRAMCERLLADFAKAKQALAGIEAAAAPADIRLAARAEAMRLHLAEKHPDAALALVADSRTIDGRTSPELDLALLEAYLAKWRAAGADEDAAKQWQQKALAVVKLLEQEHGPYWGRRGDLMLVRTAGRGGGTADLEIMVRTADNFYLQKQFDDAIAAYDKAAAQADAARDADRAFELLLKAALVCDQLERHEEALRRMREAAVKHRANAHAGRTHLRAALLASQMAAADAARLDQYIALLEEHVATWRGEATADQANMWLGQIRQFQQKWPEAIQAYLQVSPGFASYAESVAAAAACSRRWFAELKASGEPYEQQAAAAAKFFEELVYGETKTSPVRWDDVARLAAVTAARIRLQHTPGGHAAAAALLEPALAASPDADAAWKADAASLLVVALAGQETRRAEALTKLRQLAEGDPQSLLDMLAGLAQSAAAARPEARRQMAELLLEASDLLTPKQDQLDAAGQSLLVRTRAEALSALGRAEEAVSAYAALAQKYPRDAVVRRGYAAFLLAADRPATLGKALDEWRILAERTRPRTEPWYEAKYSVALALVKLGRKQEAAELIRYLQVTPPGLDGTQRKSDFEALLAKCAK
ncbi:MAG: hypothetical protein RIC55_10085 [Pirellulaceae bacterium]